MEIQNCHQNCYRKTTLSLGPDPSLLALTRLGKSCTAKLLIKTESNRGTIAHIRHNTTFDLNCGVVVNVHLPCYLSALQSSWHSVSTTEFSTSLLCRINSGQTLDVSLHPYGVRPDVFYKLFLEMSTVYCLLHLLRGCSLSSSWQCLARVSEKWRLPGRANVVQSSTRAVRTLIQWHPHKYPVFLSLFFTPKIRNTPPDA